MPYVLILRRGAIVLPLLSILMVAFQSAHGQSPTFRTEQINVFDHFGSALQADFNEDGAQDFIVQSLLVLSNGDGSYRLARPDLPFAETERAIAAGDFNNDNNVDVLTIEGSSAFTIFRGNGDGTFQTPKNYSGPTCCDISKAVPADLNRDGRLDFAALVGDKTSLSIKAYTFINTGTGFDVRGPFATETRFHNPDDGFDYRWFAGDLLLGDFDSDGKADLAYSVLVFSAIITGAPDHQKIAVLFGNGDGSLGDKRVLKDSNGRFPLAAADMNQDGRSDLAGLRGICVGSTFGGYLVFYGSSGRTFTERQFPTPLDPNGTIFDVDLPAVADFNGDRRPDIALIAIDSSEDSFGVRVGTQNADGSFTQQPYYALGIYDPQEGPRPANALLAGDFNRDRKPDIAALPVQNEISEAKSLFLAINTTESDGFPDCLHPGGRGIHVCSPASGGTASSPVLFSIGASDFVPLRKVEVWIDGSKKKETFFSYSTYSYLDAALSFTIGAHNVSVYAVGYDNRLQKATLKFTARACTTPSQSTAVSICSPTYGSTVASPVRVSARGGNAITWMEVWVDGVKRYSASGKSVEVFVALSAGSHIMNVYGKQGGAVVDKETVAFSSQ